MGPLSWSAIAAGSAALAESLGLGAAATGLIVGNKNKNIDEFKDWAKTQYPMPETTVNIPSAENALVLRPEYRTITTPVEALDIFGYKPIWAKGENSQNGSTVSGTGNGTGENIPNPEDERDKKIKDLEEKIKQLENKPKKPKEYYDSEKDLSWSAPMSSAGKFLFKSRGPGEYTPFRTLLEYSLGLGTLGFGGYYGGKALGLWGEDSNDSSNEIDREGTEQAWEDMKVGRKPGQ